MLISTIRTALLYGLLILSVRLMGKRQVAEMEPAEFVVTMLLANLASVPMQDNGLPLISGLAPIFTVLALELILAVLSMKALPVRRMLNGVPAVLIRNGEIDQSMLAVSRVSLDELMQKLREKDVFDFSEVEFAILETDGELTVMPFSRYQPATKGDLGAASASSGLCYNVITDGSVRRENLRAAGLDEAWLQGQLRSRGLSKKDLFLCTVNQAQDVRIVRKQKKAAGGGQAGEK